MIHSSRHTIRAAAAIVALLLFLCSLGCSTHRNSADSSSDSSSGAQNDILEQESVTNGGGTTVIESSEGNVSYRSDVMQVHFLDVGQADALFITSGNHAMLVDGGNTEDGDALVDYIEACGFTTIDVVVATHPHEDHIGGLLSVLGSLDVTEALISSAAADTETYYDLTESLVLQSIPTRVPVAGESFTLGDAKVMILTNGDSLAASSQSSYDDNGSSEINDASIVVRIDVGDDSFLLMGDAENAVEFALIGSSFDLDVDVLKVGHHGSKDASYWQFLDEVTPRYAVIEVGRDNDYGYPKDKVLDRLEDTDVEMVFRTDNDRTIVASTSGEGITFVTQGPILDGNEEGE